MKLNKFFLLVLSGFLLFTNLLADEQLTIPVKGYEIIGINPLSASETEKILKPYTGLSLSLDDIQKAVIALEDEYKKLGFGFYQVTLAPQTLDNDIIKLSVNALLVNKINLQISEEERAHYSKQNILSSIPALAKGKSPNLHDVIKQVELSNLNPTKKVNVLFSVNEDTFEDIVADIRVKTDKPLKYFSWLDNTGNEETGDYRLGIGFKHHNFLDKDHELSLTYTTSPDHLKEVKQFGLNYRLPFYEYLGSLQLYSYYSDIDSGTVAGGFDVSGEGQFFGAKYEWHLPKLTNYKKYAHQFVVGVEDKLFVNNVLFEQTDVAPDIRATPLSFLYKGKWKSLFYDLDFYLQYEHNISVGQFNTDSDYNKNRAQASSDWDIIKMGFSSSWIKNNYRLLTQLDAQLTDQKLISGEQFGLGGIANKLRGFDSREVNGDTGVKASFELWFPPVFNNQVNFLGFVDAGYTKAIEPSADELDNETFVSAGVGVVMNFFKHMDVSLHVASVIDGNDYGPEDSSTQKGDIGVHGSIYFSF